MVVNSVSNLGVPLMEIRERRDMRGFNMLRTWENVRSGQLIKGWIDDPQADDVNFRL